MSSNAATKKSTNNYNNQKVKVVCAMDVSPYEAKLISVNTINHLKHDDLLFSTDNEYIRYLKKANTERLYKLGEIGLFEIYGDNEFCHLFFDVDHIEDETQLRNCIDYFKDISVKFGKFSMGCYTNNINIAEKYNIPLIEESDKFFSAHVIFYESKISKTTFKRWFRPDDDYVDKSTWFDILNGTPRKMRLPFSNKVDLRKGVQPRVGKVVDENFKPLKNSCNLISVLGDEKELTDELFEELCFIRNTDEEMENLWKSNNEKYINSINKLEGVVELSDSFDEELLIEAFKELNKEKGLIHHYEKDNDNDLTLFIVFSGLNAITDDEEERKRLYELVYDNAFDALTITAKTNFDIRKEDVVVKSGNVGCLINTLKKINNGKWFNEHKQQIIKVDKDELKKLIEEDLNNVDLSILKPTTKNIIDKIKDKTEKIKTILISVRFLVNHSAFIDFIDRSRPRIVKPIHLKQKLEAIFDSEKDLNQIMKILKNKTYLPDEEITFNLLFTNWKYDVERNETVKSNYERHIKLFEEALSNIFTTDESKKYFIRWVNYILRHPGKQTKVLILIQGRQGTGKTYIAETVAEIFKGYEVANGSMNDLTAKFNIQHLGMVLYIANEIKDADRSEKSVYNTLKTKITDTPITYEEKGITTFYGQNSLNIICASNYAKPILVDMDDRRIFNVKTSSKHAKDKSYWSTYFKVRDETGFYENLTYYFKNAYNQEESDKFLELDIPTTQEKVELIVNGLNNVNKFINDNFNLVSQAGVCRNEFKELYKQGDYEMKESNMWSEYIGKCEPSKFHNVIYYSLKQEDYNDFNNLLYDLMERRDIKEEANDESAGFVEVDDIDNWIENHKHIEDKFEYVLMTDINNKQYKDKKVSIVERLNNDKWKFTKKIHETHRGYKRELNQ